MKILNTIFIVERESRGFFLACRKESCYKSTRLKCFPVKDTWEKISARVGFLSWYEDQGKKPLGSSFPKNISFHIIKKKKKVCLVTGFSTDNFPDTSQGLDCLQRTDNSRAIIVAVFPCIE